MYTLQINMVLQRPLDDWQLQSHVCSDSTFSWFCPKCRTLEHQSLGKVIPLTQCEEFCESGRKWLAVHLLDPKQIVR